LKICNSNVKDLDSDKQIQACTIAEAKKLNVISISIYADHLKRVGTQQEANRMKNLYSEYRKTVDSGQALTQSQVTNFKQTLRLLGFLNRDADDLFKEKSKNSFPEIFWDEKLAFQNLGFSDLIEGKRPFKQPVSFVETTQLHNRELKACYEEGLVKVKNLINESGLTIRSISLHLETLQLDRGYITSKLRCESDCIKVVGSIPMKRFNSSDISKIYSYLGIKNSTVLNSIEPLVIRGSFLVTRTNSPYTVKSDICNKYEFFKGEDTDKGLPTYITQHIVLEIM
jgi:hypothetical protein